MSGYFEETGIMEGAAMCDSILLQKEKLGQAAEHFGIHHVVQPLPEAEILKPNEEVPVILETGGIRRMDRYIWGIFPFWAKDSINARSEQIREHIGYKKLFAKQRCVIPCSGFSITVPVSRRASKEARITMQNQTPFGLAGIYDIWLCPDGSEYKTCTVLTTQADGPISSYHNRMPVILDQEGIQLWLTADVQTDDWRLEGLLRPYRRTPIQILV